MMYCINLDGNCRGCFTDRDKAQEFLNEIYARGYSAYIEYREPWSGTRG